jgi:hypothetical protein
MSESDLFNFKQIRLKLCILWKKSVIVTRFMNFDKRYVKWKPLTKSFKYATLYWGQVSFFGSINLKHAIPN